MCGKKTPVQTPVQTTPVPVTTPTPERVTAFNDLSYEESRMLTGLVSFASAVVVGAPAPIVEVIRTLVTRDAHAFEAAFESLARRTSNALDQERAQK